MSLRFSSKRRGTISVFIMLSCSLVQTMGIVSVDLMALGHLFFAHSIFHFIICDYCALVSPCRVTTLWRTIPYWRMEIKLTKREMILTLFQSILTVLIDENEIWKDKKHEIFLFVYRLHWCFCSCTWKTQILIHPTLRF